MGLRLEPRETTPAWLNVALSLGAVLAALVICAGLITLAGADVLTAYAIMFRSALGGVYAITETLVKAAPLIFTGLAVAVAFRAKFWNIGAEGQLLAGAVTGCWAGGFAGVPGPLAIVMMLIAGALGGAVVALIPALLRVRLKVDDVVSTLLTNSIVYYAMMALIEGPWKDPLSGYPNSPPIADDAWFPVLIEGTRLHLGVVVAFLIVPAVWLLMRKTTLGFSIRAVGENPEAAAYGGIAVNRVLLAAAALSGGLAGLAGVGEVGGLHYQVMAEISPGYGYTGIVIAMLARLNPIGVIPSALFFAAVMTGAEAMSRATGVPVFLADVIQGTALITMLVAMLFTAYRVRRTGGPAGVVAH
jgi:simple sugar transport system permease protein